MRARNVRRNTRPRNRRQRRRRRLVRRLRRMHPLVHVGVLLVLAFLGYEAYRYTREHPVAVVGGAVAVATVVGGIVMARRRPSTTRVAQGSVDVMTGPQFEQYVAGLMRRTGFRSVHVSGGAADLGADIIAEAPDGRRVVVQCKRYAGTVGSPHVQRLNGTAWTIHRAEVTMLVTTGRLSAHALDLAVRCGITVVDRAALAAWVASDRPPF